MSRKILSIIIILAMAGTFFVTGAYAMDHGKKGDSEKMGLDEKFTKKAHMVIANQEELGLSDEQVDQITQLKISLMKSIIEQNAAIEILAIDIQSELYKDTIDLDKVNALIDKKYELKKQKTKDTVAAMAEFKNVLTDEQCKSLKKMCLGGKKK